MEKQNIAGLSMKGGRRDNFFFCLIEYFPDQKRWFLNSVLQVEDEEGLDGDEAIRKWINEYELADLVLDFPLSNPSCHDCKLDCPGMNQCPVENVKTVYKKIDKILEDDQKLHDEDPKAYERARVQADQFDHQRDLLAKQSTENLLSKSFKRRIKKGYIPYWNRSIDLWVWCNYYDHLLELCQHSYDSFGNTSIMMQSRFSYLKRHFSPALELYEGSPYIVLIELLKSRIITAKNIEELLDLDLGVQSRLDIIKSIESSLNIFIYDHDLEVIVKNTRAFHSFLLAVAGQNINQKKNQKLPDWTLPKESAFIAPSFS